MSRSSPPCAVERRILRRGFLRAWIAAAIALAGGLLLSAPAQADPRGGQRWDRQNDNNAWGWRERREDAGDRRDERRERWQQMTPDERQQVQERRRMRQMSPEERQRLRRDILEANRGLGGR